MTSLTVTSVQLTTLPKVAAGKVRDLFDIDANTLLFVASDRTSAYDVILKNGIPGKGAILNLMSAHWFSVLSERVPGLRTHLVTLDVPKALTPGEKALVRYRSMQVRKFKVFPIEVIVRGYITGSAWKEYQKTGTVHKLPMPAGLKECQAFPQAIYTPSTKAELGQHDENITPEEAAKIVGDKYAPRIEELALKVYNAARDYAAERGIIIADTKFEFGLDEATDEIVLIDEVLTPDSSRMWPADKYEVGHDQESFDKQFIRNWLTKEGLKGKDGVAIPDDIAQATSERYQDAFRRLTGKTLEETIAELSLSQ
ncbi:putative phosphoribosylaminoimidazole-succinocarboxamide synthase protein [Phaeoacremonium minimum UCRPA7]|uniref:Phosphoribosylaminoimidazole-succinocarboxamide synthase n=1 Tax=Phaeoacremonium minimum (strain UCR-PA7) TaxID=1286976 RepID=R8BHJ9_PHAM7|nr:putative phosphoribosylaminoimidazole-succinocarboxamide synthase protein [Phaeoacremonium minimum UCRPA7]EON98759.1 putative phosphoribosylaminoimidazole-succinocarboxamide synthase protein [Phaeoacremonium minimum UCRPA7]